MFLVSGYLMLTRYADADSPATGRIASQIAVPVSERLDCELRPRGRDGSAPIRMRVYEPLLDGPGEFHAVLLKGGADAPGAPLPVNLAADARGGPVYWEWRGPQGEIRRATYMGFDVAGAGGTLYIEPNSVNPGTEGLTEFQFSGQCVPTGVVVPVSKAS